MTDKCTHNLLNGINLILSKHPEGKVRAGYSQDIYVETKFINQNLRTDKNTLSETEEELLRKWGWDTEDRHDSRNYWSYDLLGVDS